MHTVPETILAAVLLRLGMSGIPAAWRQFTDCRCVEQCPEAQHSNEQPKFWDMQIWQRMLAVWIQSSSGAMCSVWVSSNEWPLCACSFTSRLWPSWTKPQAPWMRTRRLLCTPCCAPAVTPLSLLVSVYCNAQALHACKACSLPACMSTCLNFSSRILCQHMKPHTRNPWLMCWPAESTSCRAWSASIP